MIVLDQKSEQRKFFIGENTATALDLEGNKIDGSLAEYYVLKRKVNLIKNPAIAGFFFLYSISEQRTDSLYFCLHHQL